jgi:type I restriction enzyme S subunit
MSDALPPGWTTAALGEIAEINPRHPKGLDDSMLVSFVPMAAVSASKADFKFVEERPLGKVRQGFTHFAEGDVLFAKITPCMENGKGAVATGLRNGLGCGTTELVVIRPGDEIDPHYIYRFLAQPSVRREAKENFTGTAGQARVPTGFIEQLEIPLAPLAEQPRIVEKLEMLLDKVGTCQDRLAKIPIVLKRFRQSILAAACSGRLTVDWREQNPDVESATIGIEKLEKATAGVQVRRGVPEDVPESDVVQDWELPETWGCYSTAELLRRGALEDLKDGNHGANHPKVSEFTATGLSFITAAQVNNFRIDYEGAHKLAGKPLDRIRVGFARPGDVIYTHKGSVGRVATADRNCVLTPQTTYYRVSSQVFVDKYVMFYLASQAFSGQVNAVKEQTTRDFVPISEQYLLFHRVPPLAEQREIVHRVEALFALANKIEGRLAKAQAQVDKLAPSLLAKAFSGELVPTEAELAHRERREYEPASVLVERLQREREGGRSATKEEHAVSKTKRRVTPQRTRVMSAPPRGLGSKRILTKKPPQTAR